VLTSGTRLFYGQLKPPPLAVTDPPNTKQANMGAVIENADFTDVQRMSVSALLLLRWGGEKLEPIPGGCEKDS